jgi:hypothetical protein
LFLVFSRLLAVKGLILSLEALVCLSRDLHLQ